MHTRAIIEAVAKASRAHQTAEIIGEDCTALTDLRSDLVSAIARVDEIMRHSHDWNDDGICNICAADGNA